MEKKVFFILFFFIVVINVQAQLPKRSMNITIKNDLNGQNGGNIGLGIGNSQIISHQSPFNVSFLEDTKVYFQAYDNQFINNEVWYFNDYETSYNNDFSEWQYTVGGSSYLFSRLSNPSCPIPYNCNDASFTAILKKKCKVKITCESGIEPITASVDINGVSTQIASTEPLYLYKVNNETINLGGISNMVFSGPSMKYHFGYWLVNGVKQNNILAYPHVYSDMTIKAYFIGEPTNDYKTMVWTPVIYGQPISFSWNDHPNLGVTDYYIYRQNIKTDSAYHIATVSRGNPTFTDDYVYSTGGTDHLLWYDVKAHYQPDNTLTPYDASAVYGKLEVIRKKNIPQDIKNLPKDYSLSSYPNPFNPSTLIRYSLPEAGQVSLKVYNLLAQEVASLVNEYKPAGNYSVDFNAVALPSGIYIAKLQAGSKVMSFKLQLVK